MRQILCESVSDSSSLVSGSDSCLRKRFQRRTLWRIVNIVKTNWSSSVMSIAAGPYITHAHQKTILSCILQNFVCPSLTFHFWSRKRTHFSVFSQQRVPHHHHVVLWMAVLALTHPTEIELCADDTFEARSSDGSLTAATWYADMTKTGITHGAGKIGRTVISVICWSQY